MEGCGGGEVKIIFRLFSIGQFFVLCLSFFFLLFFFSLSPGHVLAGCSYFLLFSFLLFSLLLFSFLLFFSFSWSGAPRWLLSSTSAVDKLATLRATYSVSQTSAPATFSIPSAVLCKVCLMWTNPSRRSPWRSLSLLIMFLWTVNQ